MANLKFPATLVFVLGVWGVSSSFAQTPPWQVPVDNPAVPPTQIPAWSTPQPEAVPMPVQNPWPESPAAWELEQAARAQQEAQRAFEEQRRWVESFLPIWPDPTPEEEEARRQAALRAGEKNYTEMMEAAKELAAFSQKISDGIKVDGERVVSKAMLKDLDRLEKLAKKVRDRGKRLPRK